VSPDVPARNTNNMSPATSEQTTGNKINKGKQKTFKSSYISILRNKQQIKIQ